MASSQDIIVMSEVIITLLIGKLLEVVSEKAILHKELEDRLSQLIKELEDIMYDTSNGTETEPCSLQQCKNVMICAREAEDIADTILVESSRRQSDKSLKGSFIRTFAELMGSRGSQAQAQKLIEKLVEVSWHYNMMRGRRSNAEPRLKLSGESRECGTHRAESLMKRRMTMTSATGASVSTADMPGFVGRENEIERLKGMLEESNRESVISVTGAEGIGKTALVRRVYNSRQIERQFLYRAWISCSKDMSQRRFLVELIKQCPPKELEDLDCKETDVLSELLSSLLTGKRYLIVLDIAKDASMDISWLPYEILGRQGSKVIIISRNILQSLRSELWGKGILLTKLELDSCRKFLPENTLTKESRDTDTILEYCRGSPLKLILCRGLVMDADAGSLDVLHRAWNIEDVMYRIFQKLPPWVKPCLLHFCLFPRESEILTRRIFQLWYTEGMARWYGPDTPEACLQELLNRNIVEVDRRRQSDQKPKACHLLGCWHDYLSKLAKESGLLHIEGEDKHVSLGPTPTKAYRWVARCSGDNRTLPAPDAETVSSVQSYISFQTGKNGTRSREVKQLLKPLHGTKDRAMLRVLDLEGVYRPTLPVQFGDLLPNLRYLGLRWTILDSLPKSVANLSKLETLDLKHTEVTELPGSILNLKSLRHLYLNEVSFDNYVPSGSFGSNLETLWGLSVDKGSPMLKALGKLRGLRKLGLTCHSADVWEATETLTTLMCLQLFRLRSRDLLGQPGKLELGPHMKGMQSMSKLYLLGRLDGFGEGRGRLPKNLQVLTLSMSELQYDPMAYLGQLPRLVRLSLLGRSFIGQTITCPESSFPSLRELRLWNLQKLREIRFENGSMRSLEELEIRGCKEVWKMDDLSKVTKLTRIKLTEVAEHLATKLSKENPTLRELFQEDACPETIPGLPWRLSEEDDTSHYGGIFEPPMVGPSELDPDIGETLNGEEKEIQKLKTWSISPPTQLPL